MLSPLTSRTTRMTVWVSCGSSIPGRDRGPVGRGPCRAHLVGRAGPPRRVGLAVHRAPRPADHRPDRSPATTANKTRSMTRRPRIRLRSVDLIDAYHATSGATVRGMSRVRISATVDGERLEVASRLAGETGSRLLDRALAVLIEHLETDRELAVLASHPYDKDPDLAWEAPPGPDLPYEGAIPDDVLELAQARRRSPLAR